MPRSSPLSESAGGGVWLLAIVSALALLLAPATAVAEQDTTPPSILESWVVSNPDFDWIVLRFTEHVDRLVFASYSVTYDGVSKNILQIGRVSFADHDHDTVAFRMDERVPDGAAVVVSYVQPEFQTSRLRSHDHRYVESFTWDVTANRQVPPEQAVYYALGRYFSGSGSLSSAERFVASYFEDLLAKVAEGGLSGLFGIGDDDEQRSAWGTEGTEDWGQVGSGAFPREFCYWPPGADTNDLSKQRCVDTQAEWGWGTQYQCGGRPQPGLADNDYLNFFWACTDDGQWVPVKRHRPGVDYSHDSDLIRPDPSQNVGRNDPDGTHDGTDDEVPDAAKCLFRDEAGNLAPLFRAEIDPNTGRPVRTAGPSDPSQRNDPNLPADHPRNWVVQGTTIHGRNWDPIAKQCRGS